MAPKREARRASGKHREQGYARSIRVMVRTQVAALRVKFAQLRVHFYLPLTVRPTVSLPFRYTYVHVYNSEKKAEDITLLGPCSFTHSRLPLGVSRTSASHSAHSMGPTCVQVWLVRRPLACTLRKHLVQKPSPHWSHFLVDLFCSHSTQLDCFRASNRSSSVMPGLDWIGSSKCEQNM